MKKRLLLPLLLALSVCIGRAPDTTKNKIQSLEPGSFGRVVAAGKRLADGGDAMVPHLQLLRTEL